MSKAYIKQPAKSEHHEIYIDLIEARERACVLAVRSNAKDGELAKWGLPEVQYVLERGKTMTIVIED